MKKLLILVSMVLAGCAASQEDLNAVSKIEAARFAKSSKPLSEFAAYDLKAMSLSPEVAGRPEKVEQAAILEEKIRKKLQPLLAEWTKSTNPGGSGTLTVQPELVRLKIVSGGARFFAGAWVGESYIDLDLRLIEAATNKQIAKPRITKNASAFGGAWSIGQTDQNLHDYIAHITHQFMIENY